MIDQYPGLTNTHARISADIKKPLGFHPKVFLQQRKNYPNVARAALKVALGRKAAEANFSSKR